MNLLIAGVVGLLAASAVAFGGVHAVEGDRAPVTDGQLYGYADE